MERQVWGWCAAHSGRWHSSIGPLVGRDRLPFHVPQHQSLQTSSLCQRSTHGKVSFHQNEILNAFLLFWSGSELSKNIYCKKTEESLTTWSKALWYIKHNFFYYSTPKCSFYFLLHWYFITVVELVLYSFILSLENKQR